MPVGFDMVNFTYPGREILRRFSLELPEKGVLCLSGPSGCGKTTLLRLLAGLEQAGGGRMTGLSGLSAAMVFQEDRLLPWCTALENVALAAAGETPAQRQRAAAEWLRLVELGEAADSLPSSLSGGMKRRVAIARALAAPADLLLLDEPFGGLDRPLWSRIASLIVREGERRLVVAVTHVEDEAQALSARRVMLAGPPLAVVLPA